MNPLLLRWLAVLFILAVWAGLIIAFGDRP